MLKENKRLLLISLIPAIILLIPLIAMQFTDEVHWTIMDFVVAAVLLFGISFLTELVLRKVTQPKHRFVLIILLLLILLLIWAEMAVGLFGSPFAGT